jgi:hypothetical protein
MGFDDEHAEALEIVMPGGAQGQPIADAGTILIWACNDIESQRKVGGGSGHRTDHRKVRIARQGRGRRPRVPAIRDKTQARLVSKDAAKMRRHPQRSTNV